MVPVQKSEQVIQLAFRAGVSFCAHERSPIHSAVDRAFFMRYRPGVVVAWGTLKIAGQACET
jgi:hypothetical protein